MDGNEARQLEQTLRQMGIDPIRMSGFGQHEGLLPPLPASDPESVKKNSYDGFYDRNSREYWQFAEITSHEVQEPKKCQHYLRKENNEIRCTKCHIGWVVGEAFQTQDGKLYDKGQELIFAV